MLFDTLTQFDRLGRELFSIADRDISAPVDIRREGDRYVIEADLPGVDPRSVDLTVEGDSLTIRAERSDSRTAEEAQWVVRERSSATIVRRFTLGDDIDPDRIEAAYRDGVLSVVVPVHAGAARHKIPVAVSSPEPKALGGSTGDSTGDSATVTEGKAEAAHSLDS